MICLKFEKIYSTDRIQEPCYIGLPFPRGEVFDIDRMAVYNSGGSSMPAQFRATALWEDKSIKWLFARFYADIPANKGAEYYLDVNSDKAYIFKNGIKFDDNVIDNGALQIKLSCDTNKIFDYVFYDKKYNDIISCPMLRDKNTYDFKIDNWSIEEQGSLCCIFKGEGWHILDNKKIYKNEIKLTVYLNKPYFELSARLINTSNEPLKIKSYIINVNKSSAGDAKYTAAISNYKTKFFTGDEAYVYVDAELLKYESNEQFAEVFYGTFFGDYSDEELGICAAVYQAQQNFPKAVRVDKNGIEISLVPENIGNVTMQSGMSREQKTEFYFHKPYEDIQTVNDHSIIYQMPDRPLVEPYVFERADVFPNVFVKNKDFELELYIASKADEHSRCYGMLNWGDSPDNGYTDQGRGGGRLVWANNEYDFPHGCALQYVRTGVRKYLDYVIASVSHWMDVDICHYSNDELKLGGQYEHTNNHIVNGKIVCSHQWVEGLLDYYHFTGDKRAYDTAIGIGKNLQRLLEQPQFKKYGDVSARETGWALRSLTALYIETGDKAWLEKCDSIVNHFKEWEDKYGLWLSAYTDNTAIRVVFMIAVAVGSLMRYYRVNKNDEIKNMILRAVDDLCENALMDNGLFYYKELPSLRRAGVNPTILEALAIAYELTGDLKYIKIGIPTLRYVTSFKPGITSMKKTVTEDAVIAGITGTKSFAQSMLPITVFYSIASRNGLL